MQKTPLLAVLPLIAACGDGPKIEEVLARPDVQNVIATVQDRCADLIKHGQLLGDRITDDSFIASLNYSNCQCDVSDGIRCEFKHGGYEGREQLLLRDNVINGERVFVSQIQDDRLTLSISVDPYNYRGGCDVRAFDDFSFASEQPDAMKACRDFRFKVSRAIMALIDMVRQR